MDDVVMEILMRHKEEQEKLKAIAGDAWIHPEMVFTNHTGDFFNKGYLNTQFRKFIAKHREELGLSENLTVHGLRHTNASLLLYAGESLQNISAHLGHANSEVTSVVYSHMYAEVRVRLARTVSTALFEDE
jgi:integrase